MAHEIEEFLLESFNKRASTTRVHPNQLKRLKKILNQLKNSSDYNFKITDLRERLYYLNNLLSECLRLSSKCPILIFTPHNVQAYREVGKSLKEVRLNLEENYHEILATPQEVQEENASLSPTRLTGPPNVHGFKEEIIAMERMVLPRPGCEEEKFKAVGIAGIAGVGKTTLCKELLKREKVRKHFVPRIYVQLSRGDKMEGVLKKILKSLGVEDETVDRISTAYNFEGLVCAVYAQLMGKRYLLVLDNAFDTDQPWYEDLNTPLPRKPEWKERLAYGLPKGYGGTVLVASRDPKVIAKMVKVEENVHRLRPLADRDSTWNIFVDALGVGVDETKLKPEVDVKDEILKKCAGVPLAAKTIGEIMNELMNAQLQDQIQHTKDKKDKELSRILRQLLFPEPEGNPPQLHDGSS